MMAALASSPHDRDQDTEKRLSGVWSASYAEPKETPYSNGVSNQLARQESLRGRRAEAATFVRQLTGTDLAFADDAAFREALSDGVLLSKVVNAVFPGVIKNVAALSDHMTPTTRHQRRYETVQSLIRSMQTVQAPDEVRFSYDDVTSDSEVERPRVVDCLLWLKRQHEPGNTREWVGPGRAPSITTEMDVDMVIHDQCSPVVRAEMAKAVAAAPAAPPLHAAKQPVASQGVAQLLNQFSTILKADMQPGTGKGPDGSSLDELGPVFHTVLGNLTSEYERKLQAKDHDGGRLREQIATLQSQVAALQREVAELKDALATANAALDAAGSEAERALGVALAALKAQLAEKDAALAAMRAQLDGRSSVAQAEFDSMRADVDAMRAELEGARVAEERYRATREENRRLYNQVQDLKGAIRVFCRIRPAGRTGELSVPCMEAGEEGELAVHDPAAQGGVRLFSFDKIFGEETTQEIVYEDVQPLIRSVLDGYNVCIFAYGQTGSGKTHTMSGTDTHTAQGRGINFRALEDLFAIMRERSGTCSDGSDGGVGDGWDYSIKVQMLEIYNETVRDLLAPRERAAAGQKLDILNTQPSGCNVRGAEQVPVAGPEQVVEIMDFGASNRAVGGTNMNERSSRSHQVLTVVVDGSHRTSGTTVHACLNLVDLAGSERVKQSKAQGDRLVETCNINSSLSALGDVMAALARKEQHVPFRNSKLTQMLADSLGGSAKVMMFMHVSPESAFMGESISTLNFGGKVASVSLGQARRNVDNTKQFASEEVARSKREAAERAAEKDGQLAQERRRTMEERRRADALQKEVDRLKAQLDAAKRTSFSSPAPSDASTRRLSRDASWTEGGGGATPSARMRGSTYLLRSSSLSAGGASAAGEQPLSAFGSATGAAAAAASTATPSAAATTTGSAAAALTAGPHTPLGASASLGASPAAVAAACATTPSQLPRAATPGAGGSLRPTHLPRPSTASGQRPATAGGARPSTAGPRAPGQLSMSMSGAPGVTAARPADCAAAQ